MDKKAALKYLKLTEALALFVQAPSLAAGEARQHDQADDGQEGQVFGGGTNAEQGGTNHGEDETNGVGQRLPQRARHGFGGHDLHPGNNLF